MQEDRVAGKAGQLNLQINTIKRNQRENIREQPYQIDSLNDL